MKKNILFLITNLQIGGGAQRIASSLSNKLNKKYNLSLITFYDSKDHYFYNGNYISLKEKPNSMELLFRPLRVYRLIKKYCPDVIISFMDHVNFFAIFLKMIFRLKIPLIITIHTNPKMMYMDRNRYFNFLIKILYGLSAVNKIVSISKEIQYILEFNYKIKKDKLKMIYNGIDLEKIKLMANDKVDDYEEIFNNPQIIKFITIGRLSYEKGHEYLIKAYSKVITEIPNSKLFIIGEGPLRTQLEKLIKVKRLNNKVILLGLKENPYKYISKANVFVLSSLNEGLPTVILEALACGLPIISTDCKTGPREILDKGKYGILTKVKDVQDLAQNMIILAKNPSMIHKYSILSLERAKFFDLDRIINDWIDLIDYYLKCKFVIKNL